MEGSAIMQGIARLARSPTRRVAGNATLPINIEGISARWPLIGKVGLAILASHQPEFLARCEAKYREMAKEGAMIPASEHLKVLEEIYAFRSSVGSLFLRTDVVMMPSTAAQPWEANIAYPASIDGQNVSARGHAVFTGWVNASGHPAISLPCAPDRDGMPIGFQLIADFGEEELLLDLAVEYEEQVQFPQRWPEIAHA
jgi:aspartyl-tRNA(Asn)/glutamyl-tRNA(Gln) amidotransferase subunit A